MKRFFEQLKNDSCAKVTTPNGTRCTITLIKPAYSKYLGSPLIWDILYKVEIHERGLEVTLSHRWNWDDFVAEWKL